MSNILSPFTLQVWLLHITMMIFGGIAIFIMEVSAGHIRDGEEGDEGDDEGEAGKFSGNRLQKSVFHAFAHFLWNKPHHHPRSATGRLGLLGLCFHTLIMTASYTASLAGFLATPVTAPIEVSSFEKIQDASLPNIVGKLCCLQSNQGLFAMLDVEKLVPIDDYGPMYEALYTGRCGSLVTGANEYLIYVQAETAIFTVCANQSDPLGYSTCGPTKVIQLQCTCPGDPKADPSTCPDACPDSKRYQDMVPADQVISQAIVTSRLNNDLNNAKHVSNIEKGREMK